MAVTSASLADELSTLLADCPSARFVKASFASSASSNTHTSCNDTNTLLHTTSSIQYFLGLFAPLKARLLSHLTNPTTTPPPPPNSPNSPTTTSTTIALGYILLDVLLASAAGNHFDDKARQAFKIETEKVLRRVEQLEAELTDTASGTTSGATNNRYHLYATRCSLLLNDLKESKKSVKSATKSKTNVSLSREALYLKANYESESGNVRRSLKLCMEGRIEGVKEYTSETSEGGGSEETESHAASEAAAAALNDALYYNNLAALHASIDKHHCALLYYQKALAIVTSPSAQASFSPSTGSPLMFPHAEILYNCALCNLAVRHFKSAYECMAVCVATPGVGSRVFAMRPHCWLRMGDALLGIYSDLRDEHAYIHTGEQAIDANLFGWHYYAVTLQGTHPGLGGVKPQPPPAQLGSQTDLDSVAVDPLSRALYCYSRAISLIEGSLGEAEKARHAVYLPACLCLAYVYLEVRMFKEAVQFSAEVLSREKDVGNAQENEVVITSKEELVNRAKLYHSEASFLAKNDK